MDTRKSRTNEHAVIGKSAPTPQQTAERLVGFFDRATTRLKNAMSHRDVIDDKGRDLEDRDPTFGSGRDDGRMWISGDVERESASPARSPARNTTDIEHGGERSDALDGPRRR